MSFLIILLLSNALLIILDYSEPWSARRRARISQYGERCQATVIRIDKRFDDNDEGLVQRWRYQIVVKFVDSSGQIHRVNGEVGRRWSYSRRQLQVESPVAIAYDRVTPNDLVYLDVAPARGFDRLTDWTLCMSGIAALLAGIILWTEFSS